MTTNKNPRKGIDRAALERMARAQVPLTNIALALGAYEVVVRREIAALCQEAGFTYDEGRGGRGKAVSRTSPESYEVRFALSNWMLSYQRAFGEVLSLREMAIATGMSLRQAKRAMVRPYDHDWTLSQLSRFSRALGLSLNDLLIATTKPGIGALPRLDPQTLIPPNKLDP